MNLLLPVLPTVPVTSVRHRMRDWKSQQIRARLYLSIELWHKSSAARRLISQTTSSVATGLEVSEFDQWLSASNSVATRESQICFPNQSHRTLLVSPSLASHANDFQWQHTWSFPSFSPNNNLFHHFSPLPAFESLPDISDGGWLPYSSKPSLTSLRFFFLSGLCLLPKNPPSPFTMNLQMDISVYA